MPSIPTLGRLFTVPGATAVQFSAAETGVDPVLVPGIRFVVGFVIFAGLGAAAITINPKYTQHRVQDIRDDLGGAAGWGLLVGVVLPVGLALVALTVIGAVLSIPGLLFIAFLGIVGTAITAVWAGSAAVGGERIGAKEAVVGGFLLAVPFAIPGVGGLVVNLITLIGLGVVGRGVYEDIAD